MALRLRPARSSPQSIVGSSPPPSSVATVWASEMMRSMNSAHKKPRRAPDASHTRRSHSGPSPRHRLHWIQKLRRPFEEPVNVGTEPLGHESSCERRGRGILGFDPPRSGTWDQLDSAATVSNCVTSPNWNSIENDGPAREFTRKLRTHPTFITHRSPNLRPSDPPVITASTSAALTWVGLAAGRTVHPGSLKPAKLDT